MATSPGDAPLPMPARDVCTRKTFAEWFSDDLILVHSRLTSRRGLPTHCIALLLGGCPG